MSFSSVGRSNSKCSVDPASETAPNDCWRDSDCLLSLLRWRSNAAAVAVVRAEPGRGFGPPLPPAVAWTSTSQAAAAAASPSPAYSCDGRCRRGIRASLLLLLGPSSRFRQAALATRWCCRCRRIQIPRPTAAATATRTATATRLAQAAAGSPPLVALPPLLPIGGEGLRGSVNPPPAASEKLRPAASKAPARTPLSEAARRRERIAAASSSDAASMTRVTSRTPGLVPPPA
mmetsp:Transcript_10049/g.28832  ORF Transcript_10049/g.28832 Transcript_10049/m.28832 type:complete len:232 (+) Transcript_10049:1308-2003(+)